MDGRIGGKGPAGPGEGGGAIETSGRKDAIAYFRNDGESAVICALHSNK